MKNIAMCWEMCQFATLLDIIVLYERMNVCISHAITKYYSIYVVNIEWIISNINVTIENNIISLVLFIYRVQCNLISRQYEQAYLFVGQVFNVK